MTTMGRADVDKVLNRDVGLRERQVTCFQLLDGNCPDPHQKRCHACKLFAQTDHRNLATILANEGFYSRVNKNDATTVVPSEHKIVSELTNGKVVLRLEHEAGIVRLAKQNP